MTATRSAAADRPLQTRFKPGQSGNPFGRPKKKPNPMELEAKLLFADKHSVRANGKARKYNAFDAAELALITNAFKGNQRAIASTFSNGGMPCGLPLIKKRSRTTSQRNPGRQN